MFYIDNNEYTFPRLKLRFRMRVFPTWLCKWLTICKWKTIAKAIKKYSERVNDGGNSTCAYCAKFVEGTGEYSDSPHCEECPIFIRTGEKYCEGTPYDDYIEAENNVEARLDAAEREIAFLKSVEI